MKDVHITISGQAGTGKTPIMLMIEQFLKEKGFNVELQLENELLDYGSRANMYSNFYQNYFEREIALVNSVKITLETKQLHIDITKNDKTQAENN